MSITATLGVRTTTAANEFRAQPAHCPLVLIECAGDAGASVGAFLRHLPPQTGVAWLLLGDLPDDLDLGESALPVNHPAAGDILCVDTLSLIAEPADVVLDRERWSRRAWPDALPALRGPPDGRVIGHVLLGQQAALDGTATAQSVRRAGGICAYGNGTVLDVLGPAGLAQAMPLAALGCWLAERLKAIPASAAPERPARSGAAVPVCLITREGQIRPLSGERHPLLQDGRGWSISDLPTALRMPLVEALQAALVGGSVQRLLRLPYDDVRLGLAVCDLVLVPLGAGALDDPAVLVAASPPRVVMDDEEASATLVLSTDREEAQAHLLAAQLQVSRLHLKAAVERLEIGNERLQKAFDDLQRAHGELKAYAADLQGVTSELYRIDGAHRQKIDELEQLTADMAGLLDAIDVGVVFVDKDLRVRRCASVAAGMLRLTEPGEGRTVAEITAGFGEEDLAPLILRTLHDGTPVEREVSCWEAGRYLVRILPHKSADGQITGAVVTLIDVAAYREAEAGRASSEERWRRLVDTAPDAIIVHEQGAVTLANRSALRILAITAVEDLAGRSLMDLIVPEGRPAVERQLVRATLDGIVAEPAATVLQAADGRRVDVEITTSAVSGGEGQAFQTVLRDVSERRRAEAEIKRLVHHDGLTGLPNRTLLLDRLETAMARASRDSRHGALMLLDLDQFKDVNDTLGHPAGDRLLQIVARRLRGTLRSTDTLARLGGDEFAIVQTDLSSQAGASGAATLAQKALDAIAEPITIDDHDLFVTCSLGVTLFPNDAAGPDQLIKNADLALYRAKAEGGHRFQFFMEQMNAEVLQKKSLERELRRGIERGELSLVFQPQYRIDSARPVGAEALVRWSHPERGPISPKMFIPVAEATGLIRPLGRWVLEEACRAIRRSVDAGHPICIGVNLSAAQLRHGDFVALLQTTLAEAGIRPELLEIEITESLLFEPSNDAIAEMLRRIAGLGVRLAVDDFGTGYSSLAYLKRFPVHKIKIDQSFVRDIGRDKDDDMIIAAMVSLAHSLGKRVIAEGVETELQLEFLRKLGCDEVQGYVLARPMPEAALTELLASS